MAARITRWVATAVALANAACARPQPAPPPPKPLPLEAEGLDPIWFGATAEGAGDRAGPGDSVVRILHAGRVKPGGGSNKGACSGTLVMPDVVLTAHHCVVGLGENNQFTNVDVPPHQLTVGFGGAYLPWGRAGVRAVIAPRCGHGGGHGDIALLVLASPARGVQGRALRLRGAPGEGEFVQAIGFGDCADHVVGLRRHDREGGAITRLAPGWFTASAAVCSGDSGGPVISPSRLDVVGVVSAKESTGDEQGEAYFTRLDAWRPLFAKARAVERDPSAVGNFTIKTGCKHKSQPARLRTKRPRRPLFFDCRAKRPPDYQHSSTSSTASRPHRSAFIFCAPTFASSPDSISRSTDRPWAMPSAPFGVNRTNFARASDGSMAYSTTPSSTMSATSWLIACLVIPNFCANTVRRTPSKVMCGSRFVCAGRRAGPLGFSSATRSRARSFTRRAALNSSCATLARLAASSAWRSIGVIGQLYLTICRLDPRYWSRKLDQLPVASRKPWRARAREALEKRSRGERMSTALSGPSPAASGPPWLDDRAYPFARHFMQLGKGRMHYVDTGAPGDGGPPLLFVHGTPTWSFEYRHLIAGLRSKRRCVAPDHLGFGLSERPLDFDYTPEAHARNLREFVSALGLREFTLVVHDFGGPIGLPLALDAGLRVDRVALLNTWMWGLDDDPTVAKGARLMGGLLGRLLYRFFNLSLRVIMPSAYGNRSKLTPALHRQYLACFADGGSRERVLWPLARALLRSTPHYEGLWAERARLAEKNALVVWGMKDAALGPHMLERLRGALPRARVVCAGGAGHWPHEEEPGLVLEAFEAWLKA